MLPWMYLAATGVVVVMTQLEKRLVTKINTFSVSTVIKPSNTAIELDGVQALEWIVDDDESSAATIVLSSQSVVPLGRPLPLLH
ncbi:hypothetical protein TNCV_4163271 [Trichonephila clavipes]|nr:hypothetical protein TNCV_4163271 [Trichonephila clavipes]